MTSGTFEVMFKRLATVYDSLMRHSPFLTYYVARQNAERMDPNGFAAGLLRVVVMIGTLAMLGLFGCIVLVAVAFVAHEAGIIG